MDDQGYDEQGYDEHMPDPESRHGKFAPDTHRFQISFRGSVPGELELWRLANEAATREGVTVTSYVRDAVRHYLACDM